VDALEAAGDAEASLAAPFYRSAIDAWERAASVAVKLHDAAAGSRSQSSGRALRRRYATRAFVDPRDGKPVDGAIQASSVWAERGREPYRGRRSRWRRARG
jgi:hypothetical protein